VGIEEKIQRLDEFKQHVLDWLASYRDADRRSELRSYINQNKVLVRQEVIEAGCSRTLTITPPPAFGGFIMRNVDPFDMLFDPPYGTNMVSHVVDMIDQTIGVLRTPIEEKPRKDNEPKIELTIERNYAFVAMAIDQRNTELEDVLDAIREGAARCGIRAECVNEAQSNERITDRILESIEKAEHVIVDLTSSRPNVFYEAGYAHGIRKIPIYIAKDGTKLEFDLKDYPVIFFKNMKQLKDGLEARLRALADQHG
jgi:nucleoside 2-deoxyribosyltransferase